MALISMRQLLDHAAENEYGVPAFNVNNLEQIRAIMEAADETDSPVILQASAGARKYAGPIFLKYLATHKAEFDPRKFLTAATNAMKEIVKARYEAFGTAGQASKIKNISSLDKMHARYVSGELAPQVN